MGWFLALIVGLVLNIIAYLLMPKPKQAKPPAAKDMEGPTAESGKPIPVLWGTLTLKGNNIIWYGDRRKEEYSVPADESGGKK